MFKLLSNISFFHNQNSAGDTLTLPLNTNVNLVVSAGTSEQAQAVVAAQKYGQPGDAINIFQFVNNIELHSSFQDLTRTAKLTFPRNMFFNLSEALTSGAPGINQETNQTGGQYGNINIMTPPNPIFNRGDRVIIELGYNFPPSGQTTMYFFPQNIQGNKEQTFGTKILFAGYIDKIHTQAPLILECKDSMYLLQQQRRLFPNPLSGDPITGLITFPNLIFRLLNQNLNAPIWHINGANQNVFIQTDLVLSGQTTFKYNSITEKSIAEIFDEFKKDYGIYSYFDLTGNLIIGLPYVNSVNQDNVTQIVLEQCGVEYDKLQFQQAKDTKIKIRYKNIPIDSRAKPTFCNCPTAASAPVGYTGDLWDGISIGGTGVGYVGDAQGDQKDFQICGLEQQFSQAGVKQQLTALAIQVLKRWKYTGLKGSITVFLEPAVDVGEAVQIVSTLYPEFNGIYEVIGVKRTFGMDGGRQQIELGIQLNTVAGTQTLST